MTQAISSHPVSISPNSPLEQFHLLDSKIKKIALLFFTAILFTIGYSAFSAGTPIANFIAIACFAGAGVLLWAISKIKIYYDPKALLQYQRDAKSMPLNQIIKEHGWRNMIKHEIPLTEDFQNAFLRNIESMSSKEAKQYYHNVYSEILALSTVQWVCCIPPPVKKFFKLPPKDKFEQYVDNINIIKDRYQKNMLEVLKQFETSLKEIHSSNRVENSWVKRFLNTAPELKKKMNPDSWFSKESLDWEGNIIQKSNYPLLIPPLETFVHRAKKYKGIKDSKVENAKTSFEKIL